MIKYILEQNCFDNPYRPHSGNPIKMKLDYLPAIPAGSETSESEIVKIVSFVDSGLNLTDSEPVLVVGSSPAPLEETLELSPFCEELESKFPAGIADYLHRKGAKILKNKAFNFINLRSPFR